MIKCMTTKSCFSSGTCCEQVELWKNVTNIEHLFKATKNVKCVIHMSKIILFMYSICLNICNYAAACQCPMQRSYGMSGAASALL